jgi:hypothetical protein
MQAAGRDDHQVAGKQPVFGVADGKSAETAVDRANRPFGMGVRPVAGARIGRAARFDEGQAGRPVKAGLAAGAVGRLFQDAPPLARARAACALR